MGRPIKFRIATPRIKIINRCIFCSRKVSPEVIMCSICRRRQSRILR